MADLNERRHSGDRPDDYRSQTARDVDRVLYSSAFRRLSGVTQVVSADETLLFHNRLTHTLKVAQIARRISERLIATNPAAVENGPGIDPLAAEAAALAHDLGHPPFGHIAEEELRELCDDVGIDGYEGNAQTFRIVTRLSSRVTTPGLNLTRRTLRGVLKYPWLREPDHDHRGRKWGAYPSERSDFDFAYQGEEPFKSPEAAIMDWADDITYAVHDLEDFYRAGLTPIDRLHHDEPTRGRFVVKATRSLEKYSEFNEDTVHDALETVLKLIPFSRPYEGTDKDRTLVHETSSNLITRFIGDTEMDADGVRLKISPEIWHEVNLLKQLTWHFVINSPDLATIQEGQKRIVRELFGYLTEWAARETKSDRLPTRLREIIKSTLRDNEANTSLEEDLDKIRARATADYIASLTEVQAMELHARPYGVRRTSIMHGWVRV